MQITTDAVLQLVRKAMGFLALAIAVIAALRLFGVDVPIRADGQQLILLGILFAVAGSR